MYLGFSWHLLMPLFLFNHAGYSLMKKKSGYLQQRKDFPMRLNILQKSRNHYNQDDGYISRVLSSYSTYLQVLIEPE